MSDLVTLRASATPLAFNCAGSARPPRIAIDSHVPAADVGTAVHECQRHLAERGYLDWDSIPAIAAKHDAPEDEVRMLCATAQNLWPAIKDSFADAITEVELSADIVPGFTLTGHVDLLTISGTVARAADWKTGRKDSSYEHQMRAYGTLILLDDATLTEVTITVIWIRDGEIENYTMTRADALAWIDALVESVVDWDGAFRPGPHCEYCPRSHECEAANALARRDIAALADSALVARVESELSIMEPAEIVALLQKAKLVTAYAERVRVAIKSHVLRNGDVVANGHRLTIETGETRSLDPLKAWPVLEAAGFKDEDFAASMRLRISGVEKRVAQNAGRGKGAKAVRKLRDELDKAGAINSEETKTLELKRS